MNLIDQDELPKYNPLSSFTTKKADTLCDRHSITICKTSSFLQSTLKVKKSVSLKTLSPILSIWSPLQVSNIVGMQLYKSLPIKTSLSDCPNDFPVLLCYSGRITSEK